jgi:hypothetical protein
MQAFIHLLDMKDQAESVLLCFSPTNMADPCSVPCRMDCSILLTVAFAPCATCVANIDW